MVYVFGTEGSESWVEKNFDQIDTSKFYLMIYIYLALCMV